MCRVGGQPDTKSQDDEDESVADYWDGRWRRTPHTHWHQFLCSVPDQGVLVPVRPRRQRPYGQTDERYFTALKMEGWRLKSGWSSLKSDTPRQSPSTNSFNNHYTVQCSNPVVETRAGEPLVCMRPFTVTKCSAWLVSKETPVSEVPSLVILKSATVSYRTIVSSPYTTAHKNTRLQKPSVPNIMGRLNNRAGMTAYGQVIWGVQRVASEPPRAPGCYSVSALVDTAKEDINRLIKMDILIFWKALTMLLETLQVKDLLN